MLPSSWTSKPCELRTNSRWPPISAAARQLQSVRLEDRGDKTLVEVIHRGGMDHFLKGGIEAGWRTQLEMLRLYLESYAEEPRAYVAEKCAIEAPADSGFAYLVAPDLVSSWLGEPSAPIEQRGQELSFKIGAIRFDAVVLNPGRAARNRISFPDGTGGSPLSSDSARPPRRWDQNASH